MKELEKKPGNGWALVPFLLFIVIYMGAGIILQVQGVEMAFYKFPSVVAMSIAVIAAFFMFHRAGINENFKVFARGAASEDVVTMLMIYLLAGGFSAVAGAMGGIEATVNLGVSVIPVHLLTAGIFVISAFMATATGTSMGTVGAVVPIAVGIVDKAGLSMPLVMAACMSGAMFGDNLSMISDTTIAATRTQGVELKDKFRTNFWCAFPAAVIAFVLLIIFGRPEHVVVLEYGNFELIKVLPYLLVLALALLGMNVFLVLLIGILSAGIIGTVYGDFTPVGFATEVWNGYQSMIEVFLLSMFGGGLAELTAHYGGLQWMIEKLSGICKGKKSAQAALCVLAGLTDMATANNTVAIIVDGNMARSISEKYHIDPRKTASILDSFTCIFQGMIPYGAQFLLVASLTKGRVSPLDIIPLFWYLFLLGFFTVLSFLIPCYEKLTLPGTWDWEEHQVSKY